MLLQISHLTLFNGSLCPDWLKSFLPKPIIYLHSFAILVSVSWQTTGTHLTADDSLDGLFKVFLVDGVREVASSYQSRLVTDVSDVSACQRGERSDSD